MSSRIGLPGDGDETGEAIVARAVPSFPGLVNLACASLGARALDASDDFFADKANLLRPGPAVFRPGFYTPTGKWMDGWESRRARRRNTGQGPVSDHDWCVVRLGVPGTLRLLEIDTSFFVGNHPPYAAVDARPRTAPGDGSDAREGARPADDWSEILPRSPLAPDRSNLFPLCRPIVAHELRLRIYPDGGVARLRAWGEPSFDIGAAAPIDAASIDAASITVGAQVVAASDRFFGQPERLLHPGPPVNMSDGWETRRRRGPGHDWVVIRLGVPVTVERLVIDTRFFIGNAPETCTVEGCRLGERGADVFDCQDRPWHTLLGPTPLEADREQAFDSPEPIGLIDHLRLSIHPDGGVARLRVWGRPAATVRAWPGGDGAVARLDAAPAADLEVPLHDCCGVERFVRGMLEHRPWGSFAGISAAAERVFDGFRAPDWTAAFDAHPRIGDLDSLRRRFGQQSGGWSEGEQASVGEADEAVLQGLIEGNGDYERRFGHRFVICATGRSAGFLLAELRRRLGSDVGQEIDRGAREQRRITALRIEKWLRAAAGESMAGESMAGESTAGESTAGPETISGGER